MIDLDRVVVTGGAGLVGRSIPFGQPTTRAVLDVTDPESVRVAFKRLRPSAVLHLAGVDIRRCEADPLIAYQVNVSGTYNVVREAEHWGVPFVFLSTGAVFSGAFGEVFFEDSLPEPVNAYAVTKCLAEIVVQKVSSRHLIVRTGWLFGFEAAPAKKFLPLAMKVARANEPIKASADQTGSPTYVADFVGKLEEVIREGRSGTLHIVNDGVATAADMAEVVVDQVNSRSRIERLSFRDFVAGFRRSESEALASRTLKLRPWQDALREFTG